MTPADVKVFIILVISITISINYGSVSKTDGILCIIAVILTYMLTVLNSIFSKLKQTRTNKIDMETVKMKFKDAPVGARFKYPKAKTIWVKINSYPKGMHNDGNGLICQWNGNVEGHQSFCSFVDEANGIDFNTEVELI